MGERGLQFRPGPGGMAGAALLTTACLGVCAAALVAAARSAPDRAAALLVAAVFALGTVFGAASVNELVGRRPMPKGVPTTVGLGLAAAFATAGLSPAMAGYGVGPLPRVVLVVLALALVRETWRLWRPREDATSRVVSP